MVRHEGARAQITSALESGTGHMDSQSTVIQLKALVMF